MFLIDLSTLAELANSSPPPVRQSVVGLRELERSAFAPADTLPAQIQNRQGSYHAIGQSMHIGSGTRPPGHGGHPMMVPTGTKKTTSHQPTGDRTKSTTSTTNHRAHARMMAVTPPTCPTCQPCLEKAAEKEKAAREESPEKEKANHKEKARKEVAILVVP